MRRKKECKRRRGDIMVESTGEIPERKREQGGAGRRK